MDNYSIKSYAGQKLAAAADRLRMQNDSLSIEQAMIEACRQNPGLDHARRYGELDNEFRKYDLYAPEPQDAEQTRLDAVEKAIASLAADEDLVAKLANEVFGTGRDRKALELIRTKGLPQAEALAQAAIDVIREFPDGFVQAMRSGFLDVDNWELARLLSANINDQIVALEEIQRRKRKAREDARGAV